MLESQGINIEKLVLYGSYAHDTYSESSDIDVVIVSDNFRGKSYWDRIDIRSNAIFTVFEPIEVVEMTPEEWEEKESPIVSFVQMGEFLYV